MGANERERGGVYMDTDGEGNCGLKPPIDGAGSPEIISL